MFVAYTLALVSAIHLRQPVKLPFPDADKAAAELDEENAAQGSSENMPSAPAMVEQKTTVSAASDDAVAAWTPPTLAPDPAIMTTDQFKHPTAQQLKEWEAAPKIDMFEDPTVKPISLALEEKKPATEAAPVPKVESKLHPVNPYGKKDDDPELAAIQQESPDAYGIVKALLMKKTMGLPMPGADAAKKESDAARSFGSEEAGPASSAHIGDMWNWKPTNSASDDLSTLEDTATVSKTVVEDAPEPQAEAPKAAPQAEVEEPQAPAPKKDMFNWKPASVDADLEAEQPAPAAAAPAAAAPAPAAPQKDSTDSDEGIALNSWLGASTMAKVPQPHEKDSSSQKSGSWGNDMMSRYAADLA